MSIGGQRPPTASFSKTIPASKQIVSSSNQLTETDASAVSGGTITAGRVTFDTYDAAGRELTDKVYSVGDNPTNDRQQVYECNPSTGTLVADVSYAYDLDGNQVSRTDNTTENSAPTVTTETFDASGRTLTETVAALSGGTILSRA